MIKLLKKLIFWSKIREQLILSSHKRTASFCRMLISESQHSSDLYNLTPKKDFGQKHIIWQYWAQGFDSETLPKVVQICSQSVDKFCNGSQYEIIRLSDDNLSEYIELPEFVINNRERYPNAIFADLLRVLLLTTYGGCWLDATVLLTGPIPEEYWNMPFFMYQRSADVSNRRYWENAYAYYYNWGVHFKVKVLNSIIFSQKNNKLLLSLRDNLLCFWSKKKKLPNYFFFQILFNELITGDFKNQNCEIVSDCTPHYLQQYINDPAFRTSHTPEEIIALTPIHKLTYKCDFDTELLQQIVPDL